MDLFDPKKFMEMMFNGTLPDEYKDMLDGVTRLDHMLHKDLIEAVNDLFKKEEKEDA